MFSMAFSFIFILGLKFCILLSQSQSYDKNFISWSRLLHDPICDFDKERENVGKKEKETKFAQMIFFYKMNMYFKIQ